MPNALIARLVLTGVVACLSARAANIAVSVVDYAPGTDFAVEFGSGLGYTNAAAALGWPSLSNPGPFGGPVDPFSPPFQKEQLVSVGTGGHLTLEFASPVENLSAHPFGVDFVVYGSAGFIITNGDFTGGGITDGSLFGRPLGTARVSVSADNLSYYVLDGGSAAAVDAYYPTDGIGTTGWPVDPALAAGAFAGKDLNGIRQLYAGSAGGTGFDLAWAKDASGQSVEVSAIRFVRFEGLSDHFEIDAVAAVPEPSVVSLALLGACSLGAFAWRRRFFGGPRGQS